MAEAETVVQQQVEAYNARDAERFADWYADDATILAPDRSVMAAGKAEIMNLYSQMFGQSPALHAEVVTRIAVGDFVIDEERVSGLVFEGMPPELHAAVGLPRHRRKDQPSSAIDVSTSCRRSASLPITTHRLIIRPCTLADFEAMHGYGPTPR